MHSYASQFLEFFSIHTRLNFMLSSPKTFDVVLLINKLSFYCDKAYLYRNTLRYLQFFTKQSRAVSSIMPMSTTHTREYIVFEVALSHRV